MPARMLLTLAVACATLALPAAASAATCTPTYGDADGATWSFGARGEVTSTVKGGKGGFGPDHGTIAIDGPDGDALATVPPAAGADACTTEESGRETAYPAVTAEGIEITRKVFVPQNGLAFARQLTILRNPGGAAATFTLRFTGDSIHSDDLRIETRDFGENPRTLGVAENLATNDPAIEPAVGALFDGMGDTDRYERFGAAGGPGEGDADPTRYELVYDVTLPAGGTAVYQHHGAVRDGNDPYSGLGFFFDHERDPQLVAGLSAAERDALRNYAFPLEDCSRGSGGGGLQSPSLVDPSGVQWDLGRYGEVFDARRTIGSEEYYGYDSEQGRLFVDGPDAGETATEYSHLDDDECTLEDGGREVVHPAVTFEGVEVTRKLFVPTSGRPFLRTLNLLGNPAGTPVTVRVRSTWDYDHDSNTRVQATSSGDTAAGTDDRWVTVDDAADLEHTLASLWDGPGAVDRFDAFGAQLAPGVDDGDPDNAELVYEDVVIPAGGTAAIVHFEHASTTPAGAAAFAAAAERDPALFAVMSDAELGALRNWARPDGDGDGVANEADNCLAAANPGQADVDRDGAGDACDADVDGDGLPDAYEAAIGGNPRSGDSDGDGVPDGRDPCPAAAGPRGCPVSGSAAAPAPVTFLGRLDVTRATASARRGRAANRRHRFTVTGAVTPPPGLAAAQACRGGRVEVVVRAGRKTLGRREVALTARCTYSAVVTLAKTRARSVRIATRFLGSRFLEPRSVRTITARLPRR